MRLGSLLALTGIALVVIGLPQPAVFEETTTECGPSIFDECREVTTVEPNYLRTVLLGLGGFLFTVGIGGWIGTYDAESRYRRRDDQEDTAD